ncbi:alpha/beta hydrolase [Spiractinospora alimapuensis]|nr:serine hydrolase family protein [Spiractinospora alimapuensis]QVQ54937.1 alpha/beta hydrolase [Spiractinospora alimapuensis]
MTGTAAGVPYLAVPPATTEPAPLVVALHALEPPRAEAALAGALPMRELSAWRIYLGLPLFGERLPAGGVAEINRRGQDDYVAELFGPVVSEAAEELPSVVRELTVEFPVLPGHVGALGVGAGAAAVLLAAVEGLLPLTATVAVNPVLHPSLATDARRRRRGIDYTWTAAAERQAARLDILDRVPELTERPGNPPLLVVTGENDAVVPPERGEALVERATAGYAPRSLRHLSIPGLAHTMGPEPGLAPAPPTPSTVLVDRAAEEWFDLHLTSGAESTHLLHRPDPA